jgi:membrane-bound lytic murein transglycosylase D
MTVTDACRRMDARRLIGPPQRGWFQSLVLSVTVLSLLSSTLVGCAHGVKITQAPQHASADGRALSSSDEQSIIKEAPGPQADLNDSGSDLNAIPIEVNRMVLMWIDYFQGQGRPHMERYLSRSTRYMPIMKDILKKEGLPEDLIYIALIESGFSSTAHSSASAVGYWQFIRGTGKRYNLAIDSFVDERRDFVKSTQAAADYFKGLYNLFGAWYLAIASYNVGENRVKNLVMKYHTRDFWKLARENKLPEETINYVPKFLAARLIAKEPEKYGFTDIEYMPPLEFSEVTFENSIDIKKLADGMSLDYDDLRDLNPSYKRGVAFAKGGKLVLRVPKGTETAAVAAAPNAAAGDTKRYVAEEDYTYYRVRRGETLASIARKFSVSQRELRSLNRLSLHSSLGAGRRIRVPAENLSSLARREMRESGKSTASVKKNAKEAQSRRVPSSTKIHVVRRGDTIAEIARKYRVSIRELTAHNRLSRNQKVPIGARLSIPE